jgi:uncharacterized membrane protein YfcA
MLEPTLILELAVLGLCTGFLAGLLGIGGGMLMVPFITLIMSHRGVSADLAVKMAIATSMATIIFTSASSVRAHHKRGAVRWDVVWRLAPGIVAGAALASMGVFSVLKGSWLALLFALFVGFSATQMLLNRKPTATGTSCLLTLRATLKAAPIRIFCVRRTSTASSRPTWISERLRNMLRWQPWLIFKPRITT